MSKIERTKRNMTKNVQKQTPILAVKFVNRPRDDIEYLFAMQYIDKTARKREKERAKEKESRTKPKRYEAYFSGWISFMIYEPRGRQCYINCRQFLYIVFEASSCFALPSFWRTFYLCDRHRDEFSVFIVLCDIIGMAHSFAFAQSKWLAGTLTWCLFRFFLFCIGSNCVGYYCFSQSGEYLRNPM